MLQKMKKSAVALICMSALSFLAVGVTNSAALACNNKKCERMHKKGKKCGCKHCKCHDKGEKAEGKSESPSPAAAAPSEPEKH